MEAVKFPEVNHTFTRPESMTEEECFDLPVFGGKRQDGRPRIVSKWKFTDAEWEYMEKNGRCMYLEIVGAGMPPVCLYVENPFEVNHINGEMV